MPRFYHIIECALNCMHGHARVSSKMQLKAYNCVLKRIMAQKALSKGQKIQK